MRKLLLVLALLLLPLAEQGCISAAQEGDAALGTLSSELRPDQGVGAFSYESGVKVRSYPSPGGSFRVWWATTGKHAPFPTDANSNQIPDTVELVARIADEVAAKVKSGPWKWPILDKSLLKDPKGYGGDERFDIYLYLFSAGDGKFERDACVVRGPTQVCTGYMLLEKSFRFSSYASEEEGIRVVLSHEFFHAIQAAYANPIPGWWLEGSATWFEEYFYPQQKDFENLTRFYLAEPGRSLNDRQRGPSDTFAYGTALFVYYMAEKLTPAAIDAIMRRQGEGMELLAAIEQVARSKKTSLLELFNGFAVRNVFTGRRAVAGQGYTQAKALAEVPVQSQTLTQFNWNQEIAPLAATYGKLSVTRPLTVTLKPVKGFKTANIFIVKPSEFAATGTGTRLERGVPVRVETTAEPLYVVFVNGDTRSNTAATLEVRHARAAPPPTEPTPEPAPEPTPEPTSDAGPSDARGTSPDSTPKEVPPTTGCGCRLRPDRSSPDPGRTHGLAFVVLLGLLFVVRRAGKRS